MILRDDDRPIRIRPAEPRLAWREGAAWAGAYRLVMHYARGMRKVGKGRDTGAGAGSKPRRQRCAVRVTYLNNRTRGQWKAHGRYLARENATAGNCNALGFNRDGRDVHVAGELERWQSSGDPRLWKLILSPEFGERIDMQQLTHNLIDRMGKDLGTKLEWIGVAHYNTEHPHIHIVIRGIRSDGEPLRIRPAYLKHGIREITEDQCTRQIGYRTGHDVAEATRREIGEHRFTSLDRAIFRDADHGARGEDPSNFTITTNPSGADVHAKQIAARLVVLQRMGLAQAVGPNAWRVRRDFEEVLRAMQRTADRQKTLVAHGTPISDDRLPIGALDLKRFTEVEGRILVHGHEDQTGRTYLMLEGTNAKVHFIEYTPEMEMLRADGGLRTNSFVRLRRILANGRSLVQVQDLGDSEKVLKNRTLLEENARALQRRGITPTEEGWGGWLGRYQAALAGTAQWINEHQVAITRQRGKDHAHGR